MDSRRLADLPTPALVLDLDAFEANARKMVSFVQASGRAIRPHAKTHKCPEIARYLMGLGAVGACAAKLSEAEALSANGISGLLVTSAVVGPHKIARAIHLAAARPETIFSVDDPGNVRDLNAAAAAAGITLNLAIDLFIGRRTGILPGEPALALAKGIDSLPNVKLHGIQAYCGYASHTAGWDARRQTSLEAMSLAVETRCLIERNGISCPWLSGGSTGTYNIDSSLDGVTELQPGSFLFMDVDYGRIGSKDGSAAYTDFQNSLFVITTVISTPTPELAIVDGGIKAFATDRAFGPELRSGGIPYQFAGDEHGRLNLSGSSRNLKVGDRLDFIIPHCDPTVNLYDRIYAYRGDTVEEVWPIAARGMSQ